MWGKKKKEGHENAELKHNFQLTPNAHIVEYRSLLQEVSKRQDP